MVFTSLSSLIWLLISNWLFLFTITTNTFLSFTSGGGGASAGCLGGNFTVIPELLSMVVVTKKKIKSRKAISAIEPAFTSGIERLAIIFYLISAFFTLEATRAAIAPATNIYKAIKPVLVHFLTESLAFFTSSLALASTSPEENT